MPLKHDRQTVTTSTQPPPSISIKLLILGVGWNIGIESPMNIEP